MIPPSARVSLSLAPQSKDEPDLTGQSRMAWNVFVSWASQFVFIVAGFVMPRTIDHKLGQATLGIWDFSWSMVGYFGLIQAGIGSSVNRYVAKHRARGEMEAVNITVSSVTFLLCTAGLLVVGATVLLAHLLPALCGHRLGEGTRDAQVVLLVLGLSLAAQISLSAFTGVITGCHRWDVHNYIKAGWHAVTVAVMILLLYLGLGIRSLAVASLAGLVLADGHRILWARALCPGMRIGLGFVRTSMMRDAFHFGIKTLAPRIGDLLLNQTSSVLVASFLGPAALALYSRPKSLVQHTNMLVSKLAFVLTPTASALHSTESKEELKRLFISSTRYAAYISLPLTIGLSIMGGPLLLLWMGPDYVNETLIALVAVGSFAACTLMPAMSILAGLNVHGRPGAMHLLAAVCSVLLVVLVLGPLKMGVEGVALGVGLPLTIVYAGYVTTYGCRRLGISRMEFLWGAFGKPLLCVIPLTVSLVFFRVRLAAQPLEALCAGSALGGASLILLYWRYVLPPRIRHRVFGYLGVRRA